jgi:hypothetical protein
VYVCVCVCTDVKPLSLALIGTPELKSSACLRAYLFFCNEHRLQVRMYNVCVCGELLDTVCVVCLCEGTISLSSFCDALLSLSPSLLSLALCFVCVCVCVFTCPTHLSVLDIPK